MTEEKKPYPSDAADKYLLRLPPGLRSKLKESAKTMGRSMNAEIVSRLEATYTDPEQLDAESVRAQIKALEDKFIDLHRRVETWGPSNT